MIFLKNSANSILLALDGITDPHNVGAIIRSAEAFDCKGIIIPQRRSAGLMEQLRLQQELWNIYQFVELLI